jgi:mono/diheme cytochrome c family protein
MRRKSQLTILILLIALISGCASRHSEPLQGPFIAKDQSEANGQKKYIMYCDKCHPGGGRGLGPAIKPNPAPRFVKAFQVRHGLGVMPSFKKDEISENDLKDITAYLQAIKKE